MRATTKGGKISEKEILVTVKEVTEAEACIVNVVPSSQLDLVVALGEGNGRANF